MSLELMYITNRPDIAALAEDVGIDRVFVDLEIRGKVARQSGRNTVVSGHMLDDVDKIRNAITMARLLVRVDPMHDGSRVQIDEVIARGADVLMLPMFTTKDEVAHFVEYVSGRVRTCLLLETPQALVRIDDILAVPGVDEVHMGLNDLSIGMGLSFMFELLSGGVIDMIASKMSAVGMPFGFGGIARIGYGVLPAEHIIAEHYRMGSRMAILSRSFCDANKLPLPQIERIFREGVAHIRAFECELQNKGESFFENNRIEIHRIVKKIVACTAPMSIMVAPSTR